MAVDRAAIRRHAIRNAFLHDGKADQGSVISKVIGEFPEARSQVKSLIPTIREVVSEINSLGIEKITDIVNTEFPDFLEVEKKVQEHRLPDLRNVKGKVVMRLAPSPSGPLHLGHSRMAILNDEYVKRYGGELILRLEDTNPSNVDPDAYTMIPEDLEWLGVNVTKIVPQTDRMDLYYDEARKLIRSGKMYICLCEQEEFRKTKLASRACPDRDVSAEENADRFDRMLDGTYAPGQAVAVVKTDLNHPNPSIRDWIAFRVSSIEHPRTGNKFRVYPMMSFSVAVDDHYLGLTHVLRGKDQLTNTDKQRYIFDYNGWTVPEYYHYGMVNMPDVILKTSIIKQGIKRGEYSGWDDIRLGTIRALKKRGYSKDTFRRYWIESGLRESDAEFSWDIFNSMNKEIVDSNARRYFFVPDPVSIRIKSEGNLKGSMPYHPSRPEMGRREYDIGKNPTVSVASADWIGIEEGSLVRLKDLAAVVRKGDSADYLDTDIPPSRTKIIQWTPEGSPEFSVMKPDGTVDRGVAEPLIKNAEGVVQLERYGYVNIIDRSGKGYFLHR